MLCRFATRSPLVSSNRLGHLGSRRLFCTATERPKGFRRVLYLYRSPLFRRTFRVVRTISILGSLGTTCYALGQIQYIDDPEGFETTYICGLIVSNGYSRVLELGENENVVFGRHGLVGKNIGVLDVGDGNKVNLQSSDPLLAKGKRVQRVFHKVKESMLQILDLDIKELEKKPEVEGYLGVSEAEALRRKRRRLAEQWSLVIGESEMPNAFVDGFLPRRIFISDSLLDKFTKDDAQLAMVLAHEMSHYVLDHVHDRLIQDAVLRVVVVALTSILDPSGGLGSFLLEVSLPSLITLGSAAFSRDQETQADQLALSVCARACYPPKQALEMFSLINAFRKETEAEGLETALALFSSHPMDKERFRLGMEQLPDANKVYDDLGCGSGIIQKFRRSMGFSSKE